MVEIPADVGAEEMPPGSLSYQPTPRTRFAAEPQAVVEAARVLVVARNPVIHAGHGVLYAEATAELVQLAEMLQAPVMTTLAGKSAFPEDHPLALGTGAAVMTGPVRKFLGAADVVFGIGCSFTRHQMSANIPSGKVLIHATNDPWDINKNYSVQYPIIGDARLVLGQFIEAVRDLLGSRARLERNTVSEVKQVREGWLRTWLPKLTSSEVPINPYRVVWELTQALDPRRTILTHDSGSPRDQLVPFYRAITPRGYLGWGKSHSLGTGLGLAMGAKLAAPDRFVVNVMGDAAFGMVGLDFETAVRNNIPICTIVLNNSAMAIETQSMRVSQERFGARRLGGRYADVARAMGGDAERVEDPAQIAPALERARRLTEDGKPVLLEFVTAEETAFSHRGGQ
jgi:acetolactate synthase-1/2/3 large subunit